MDITKKHVKTNQQEQPNMESIANDSKEQEGEKDNKPFEGITQECIQKVQKLPEQQQLIDQYKKLMNIKNNLYKLDCLIDISRAEQNQAGLEELETMRNDLLMAIQYQEDAIKAAQNSDEFKFSVERLTKSEIGRLCKAFYEKNNKWFQKKKFINKKYNAKIDEVDDENQEVKITFIGYGEARNYSTIFAKLIPEPQNLQQFEVGTYCEAIYSGDGHYYPCLIENITLSNQYQIKFKKYNERDTVSVYYLREQRQPRQSQNSLLKMQFDDLTQFKMPESLRILPNDSEVQRKAKKKKSKALKNAFKNAVIEKDSTEKKNKWKDFQSKRINRESIFQSPDSIEGKVGVMNSGRGMTNFKGLKPSPNDNSHLSRLF